MMIRRLYAGFAVAALAFAGACAGGGDNKGNDASSKVAEGASFAAGTTMARLHDAGKITIGTKFDQPGIAFKDPATGEFTGFDVQIAKAVAGRLGIDADKIEFTETISKNREAFIQNGTVDFVIGSYSITDDRKKLVDFAGPYYVTGQQLLVSKDDNSIKGPEDLKGKKVCSVSGSTSIETVEAKYGANPIPFGTYTECVNQLTNGSVDAVTTDGAVLLGYAAKQPDKLKVVGDAFSVENYGIGLQKGDTAFRDFINDALQSTFDDGSWKTAFANTLGKSGADAPEQPKIDRY
jgi:glutamate transport system substrate-binding protein